MRDRIRNHHTTQITRVDHLDCLPRKNPMHHDCINLFRTIGFECFSGFGERAAGVGHVVYEDGDFALDVAHKCHFRDFVGAETFFVNKGKGEIKTVGDRGGATCQ